jgi:hypothetical protein
MTRLSLAAFACLLMTGFASAQSAGDKSVVRLDPALDALVSPDPKVELVKGGFGFTEGPVVKIVEFAAEPLLVNVPALFTAAVAPVSVPPKSLPKMFSPMLVV